MTVEARPDRQSLVVGDIRTLRRFWQLSLQAQGKSKNTLDVYVSALDRFAEYLLAQGMPTEAANLKREHVEAFIAHLLQTRKPATASNRHRALQALFRFLVEEGEVTVSPMERLREALALLPPALRGPASPHGAVHPATLQATRSPPPPPNGGWTGGTYAG